MTSLSPLFVYQSAIKAHLFTSTDGAAPTPGPSVQRLTPAPLSPLLAYHSVLRVPHNPNFDCVAPLPPSVYSPFRVPSAICGAPLSLVTRAWVPTPSDAGLDGNLQPPPPHIADGEFQAWVLAPSTSPPLPRDSGVSSIVDFQRFPLQSLQSPANTVTSTNAVPSGNPFDILTQFSPPGFSNFAFGVSAAAGVSDFMIFLSSNSNNMHLASMNAPDDSSLHSSFSDFSPALVFGVPSLYTLSDASFPAAVSAFFMDVFASLIVDIVCGIMVISPRTSAADFSYYWPSKTAALPPVTLNDVPVLHSTPAVYFHSFFSAGFSFADAFGSMIHCQNHFWTPTGVTPAMILEVLPNRTSKRNTRVEEIDLD